jgi:hypothetical protein
MPRKELPTGNAAIDAALLSLASDLIKPIYICQTIMLQVYYSIRPAKSIRIVGSHYGFHLNQCCAWCNSFAICKALV